MKHENTPLLLIFTQTLLGVVRTEMSGCIRHDDDAVSVFKCQAGSAMEMDCPHVSSKGKTRVRWVHNTADVITVLNGTLSAMNGRITNYRKPNAGTVLFTLDSRLGFYYNANSAIFQLRISNVTAADQGLWECDVRIGRKREKNDVIIDVIVPPGDKDSSKRPKTDFLQQSPSSRDEKLDEQNESDDHVVIVEETTPKSGSTRSFVSVTCLILLIFPFLTPG